MSANHYDVLGVPYHADTALIKQAYRQKMRLFHPDQFSGERVRLQQLGDEVSLRALEARIEQAKRQTQRINAAYHVLSDPQRRADYDWRNRINVPTPSASAMPPREWVYTDSHATTEPDAPPTPAPQEEAMPWAWMVGLVGVLLLVFTGLTSFLGDERSYVVAVTDTPVSRVPVGSTDATATARAFRPTVPTRSPDTALIAADALYAAKLYPDAIALYTEALTHDTNHAEVHFKRGRTYAALAVFVDDTYGQLALADFDQALAFQADNLEVQRERGVLYARSWQQSGKMEEGQTARRILMNYVTQGGSVDGIGDWLNQLPSESE